MRWGYAGGWLDSALMRVVDVLLAIPSLLLSLAVIIALGFGITNVAFAVGRAFVGSSARVTRGEVLKIRQHPCVEAAVVGGARRGRVLIRHVLPNAAAPNCAGRSPARRGRNRSRTDGTQ